jgi:hypothetical protein
VRAYLEALEGADGVPLGGVLLVRRLRREAPDELMSRLDYRIGSNHGFPLPGGGMGSPWWQTLPEPWAAQPQALMDVLVEKLCRMVRTMPVEIAAHSTLTPPALHALERRGGVVDAGAGGPVRAGAGESGVALEISNRYRLPHDGLLRKALQAGVRFSLGSDGHTHGAGGAAGVGGRRRHGGWGSRTGSSSSPSAGGRGAGDRTTTTGEGVMHREDERDRLDGAPGAGETHRPPEPAGGGSAAPPPPPPEDPEKARRDPSAVRAEDTEPYIGLQYIARLFKIVAMIVIVAIVAEVVAGLMAEGSGALLNLIAEVIQGGVLAAMLWGAGDLTLLFIDVGHDVRAARVLLGRMSARMAAADFGTSRRRERGGDELPPGPRTPREL